MGCIPAKDVATPLEVVPENDDTNSTGSSRLFSGGRKKAADLSGQSITVLAPTHLAAFTPATITTLNLDNNYLFGLPQEMSVCTSLTSLNLSGNRFSQLPDVLQQLPSLKVLNVSNNTSLGTKSNTCDILPQVPNLGALVMSMCGLRNLPRSVAQCPCLTSLDVSFNEGITFDGIQASDFAALTSLNLASCSLKDLCPQVRGLPSLRSLDISANNVNLSLRDFFGERLSTLLEELKICSMNLTEVPLAVRDLRGLVSLDLSKNPITSLEGLQKHDDNAHTTRKSLQSLKLSACSLTTFPKHLETLSSLTHLDISHNSNFTDSAAQFHLLSNLTSLNVVGCLFASNTDGRDAEWFEIAKLSKLREVEWGYWIDKAKSTFNPYSTKFPIQLCGMPIEKLNGVKVNEEVFTSDRVSTLLRVVNDGYYKADYLFEPQALWHHWSALKMLKPLDQGYFYNFSGEVQQQRVAVSVWRYIFFLALQSANFNIVIIPPLDVAAIHYSQLTIDPSSYRQDCFKIANKLVDCNYRLLLATDGASDEKLKLHRDVWNRMVDVKIRATQRDLSWLRYDYNVAMTMPQVASSPGAVRNPLSGGGESLGSPAVKPIAAAELHLEHVLDQRTVDYFRASGQKRYVQALREFFRVSGGFLKCEEHFEVQGVELWVRYTAFLAMFARHSALAAKAGVVPIPSGNPITSDLTQSAESLRASGSRLAFWPVPTLGMQLILHVHRTAHIKYTRCLDMLNIDATLGIVWEQSREAISATAETWSELFVEPYLRDGSSGTTSENGNSSASASVDVEYNLSIKVQKKAQQQTVSQNNSLTESGLKSSLASSKGASNRQKGINGATSAGKRSVSMVTVDAQDV